LCVCVCFLSSVLGALYCSHSSSLTTILIRHSVRLCPNTIQPSEEISYPAPHAYTKVHPKISGLVAWSEKCKWYSFLPLRTVVSLFCESV
jgi:hypothetical protein